MSNMTMINTTCQQSNHGSGVDMVVLTVENISYSTLNLGEGKERWRGGEEEEMRRRREKEKRGDGEEEKYGHDNKIQHVRNSTIGVPLTRCADIQTYKIFLDQVMCIFSQEDGEGFQHTFPPKINVQSLEQQTYIHFIVLNFMRQTSLLLSYLKSHLQAQRFIIERKRDALATNIYAYESHDQHWPAHINVFMKNTDIL